MGLNYVKRANNFSPEMDFGGFWICCSTKNLLLNGIKISFLPIYSGFNPNSTGLCPEVPFIMLDRLVLKCPSLC